ncbi:trafficking kinesin-binding protein milt [Ischnura elegans]|uniref:trafficking kinesin-binding protein milt n=1 Tax=Ischnura elegans TaxID=197161 RepID=UPI001ED86EEE|nr:trafficking kinesin-binding protein milt [Ischnura elegans]
MSEECGASPWAGPGGVGLAVAAPGPARGAVSSLGRGTGKLDDPAIGSAHEDEGGRLGKEGGSETWTARRKADSGGDGEEGIVVALSGGGGRGERRARLGRGLRPSCLPVAGSKRDAETITDLCSGGNIPEVEIISLVEEQIPKYKLRADTLTDFAGYENSDWGPAGARAGNSEENKGTSESGPNLDLSPEQIRETLNYFLLCANRVDQMTRTYNDIEAVSRLLEEKEKDLELTARIGKELLEQNQGLKVRLAAIEVELRTSHEENTQLKHELQQKTQLLHALTSDEDGSPHDHTSPLISPSCGALPPLPPHHLVGGRTSARAGVELLKRRIAWLEEENKSLRVEASQLARDTQRVEEEEAKLVEGVTQQLASVSEESRLLSEELERVRNEGGRQREEVDALLDKLDAAQAENKRLRLENEELSSLVLITKENQDRLTTELADFKERYGEVMCLLTEAQENLRKVRQKELPSALAGNRYLAPPITTHHSLQSHYGDSIALELESSLNYGLSLDSGIHMPTDVSPKAPHYRKVFETVRSASRNSGSPSPSPLHHQRHPSLGGSTASFAQLSTTSTLSSASAAQSCRMSTRASLSNAQSTPQPQHGGYNPRGSIFGETPRHLYGALPSTGFHSMDSAGQSEESDHSEITTDSEDCLYPITSLSGAVRDGVPGTPGAKELQAALARIAKQQQMSKGEKAIGGYEGKTRESSLDASSVHRWSISSSLSSAQNQQLPYGCRTPDSIMSTGSSRGSSARSWRMPEKLQIVKPLEGSLTLGWWSKLATPSLSAALEERPGVKVRGGAGGEGVTQHTLLDVEEDDSVSITSTKEAPMHPGKFFQASATTKRPIASLGCVGVQSEPAELKVTGLNPAWGTGSVYTYTNSTVLHPDNTVPPRSSSRRSSLVDLKVKAMRQPRKSLDATSMNCGTTENNRGAVQVKSFPMPQSPVTSSPSQPTPQLLSRRSSISTATPTFSTALGLAKMLRERGISASSSTEDLNSCSGAHFTSATATPCNSPDDSLATTRSPSPELYEEGEDGNPIASLISSGAELLRRSLAGSLAPIPGSGAAMTGKRPGRPPLSRSDRKALVGMKLVEKLERIGVESIVAHPVYRPLQGGLVPLTTTLQVGTMYARPAVKSPMAQLTSLKSTLRSRSLEGAESGSESSVCQEAVVPKRRRQLQPRRRQDLGTVPQLKSKQKSVTDSVGPAPVTTRGTISAIFFGRKGGLM